MRRMRNEQLAFFNEVHSKIGDLRDIVHELHSTQQEELRAVAEKIDKNMADLSNKICEKLSTPIAYKGNEQLFAQLEGILPCKTYEQLDSFFSVRENRIKASECFKQTIPRNSETFIKDVLRAAMDKELLSQLYLRLKGDREYHHGPGRRPFPESFVYFMSLLAAQNPISGYDLVNNWPKKVRACVKQEKNRKRTQEWRISLDAKKRREWEEEKRMAETQEERPRSRSLLDDRSDLSSDEDDALDPLFRPGY